MYKAWRAALVILFLFSNLMSIEVDASGSIPPSHPVGSTLPDWFQPSAPIEEGTVVPPWFLSGADSTLGTPSESVILPAWLAHAPSVSLSPPPANNEQRRASARRLIASNQQPATSSHHTIYPDAVTVTGPTQVNQCDTITFTIRFTNDNNVANNVVVQSAMPAEYTPQQQTVCSFGSVPPNATETCYAVFTGGCDAVSGQNVVTLTQDGYPPIVKRTEFEVRPGAIQVTKVDQDGNTLTPARLGDLITWTIRVENTGFGNVNNVRITDTMGAGISHVSGPLNYGPVSVLTPGGVISFQVVGRVDACTELWNDANASWGCAGNTCQSEVARATIDFIREFPALDYTPPDINIHDYCSTGETYSFQVRNLGDGTAYNVQLGVQDLFDTFSVTAAAPVTIGFSTDLSQTAFFLPDIPPGGSQWVTFTVSLSDWCSSPAGSGRLTWTPRYYDGCGEPYFPPIRNSSYEWADNTPSLTVNKTASARVVQPGDTITYELSVNYEGAISCGSGQGGDVYITDTLPSDVIVVDTGGGTYNAATGVITWVRTLAQVASGFTATVVVRVKDINDGGCVSCGDVLENRLDAAYEADCCGCAPDAQSATVESIVICGQNSPGTFSSDKRVSSPVEICSAGVLTFTNHYTFDDASGWNGSDWTDIVFTDTLPHGEYVSGSLQMSINGSDSCWSGVSVSPGPPLVIDFGPGDFSSCVPSDTVRNTTLVITYAVSISTPGCDDLSWEDWSEINITVSDTQDFSNTMCASSNQSVFGRIFTEAAAERGHIAVSISGLPDSLIPCGVYTPTITLSRTSTFGVYDVLLTVDDSDFALLTGTASYGGVTPVGGPTAVPGGVQWNYGDGFTSATMGTITLQVQGRCTGNTLNAHLDYNDLCNDDQASRSCSADDSASGNSNPPYLFIFKEPQYLFATAKYVTWTVTVKNTGVGDTVDVVAVDTLAPGLRLVNTTAPGANVVTSTNRMTYTYDSLPHFDATNPASSTRLITVVAEMVACDPLTNSVSLSQGCLGNICIGPIYDDASVQVVDGQMIATNIMDPAPLCEDEKVTLRVKNSGNTVNYVTILTQTLPAGMQYVSGTSEYRILDENGTEVVGWSSPAEPLVSGQQLIWSYSQGTTGLWKYLNELPPLWTIEIRYDVRTNCDFENGRLRIDVQFEGVCGQKITPKPSFYAVTQELPPITIDKQGANVTTGSAYSDLTDARAGDVIVWRIVLRNSGDPHVPARFVELYDVEPSSATGLPHNIVSGPGTPPVIGGSGTITDPWIVSTTESLDPSETWTFYVTSTVDTLGCGPVDNNTAYARWGCPDGCREDWINDPAGLRTRPENASISAPARAINRCGGDLQLTFDFEGPPAYNVRITDTLPAGLVYSETTSISGTYGTVGYPSNGDNPAVWTFDVVTSPITIDFRARNGTGGMCANWTGNHALSVGYQDSCGNAYSATGSGSLTNQSPSLSVEKTPEHHVADIGDVVTWTITVRNTGSGEAQGVVVTDTVGSGFSSWGGLTGSGGETPTVSGNQIVWVLNAPLPASGVWTAQVTATVRATDEHFDVVTATGTCDVGCRYATVDDRAHVTLLREFVKTPEVQTGTIGSIVTFTIDSHHSGPDAVYANLLMTDTLPDGLGYVAATLVYTYDGDGSDGGPYQAISNTPTITPGWLNSGNITWRLGDLSGTVDLRAVITAVVQDNAFNYDGATHTNRAYMSYRDDDQPYFFTETTEVHVIEPILHLGKSYVTPAGCGAVLFQDDFNDGNAAGWSGDSGWSVVDGVYQTTNDQSTQSAGDPTWTDYSYSVMLRARDNANWIGLYARYQNSDNYYWLQWETNQIHLHRRVGGSTTIVATDSGGFQPNRWHHVEMRLEGRRIRIYTDGQLRIDYTDSSADALTHGRIALRAGSGSGSWQYDDVLVTRLGNPADPSASAASSAPCLVGANDLVTYTLTISNQARWTGYDLVVTDSIPAGMSLVTYTMRSDDPASTVTVEPAPIPGATGDLVWNIDRLAPRSPFDPLNHTALQLTVTLQVADNIAPNLILDNQASLIYDNWEQDGDPLGDSYGIDIERTSGGGSHSTAVQTVNASIYKEQGFRPSTISPTLGTLITYTLYIPPEPITATLYSVRVTDTLNTRLYIESVAAGGGTGASSGWSGQTVTATFASIPHGDQGVVTITARISHEWPSPAGDANAGDVIADVAQMTHATAPVTTSNQVSITVHEPQLTLIKTSDPPTSSTVGANDPVTYTLQITNWTDANAGPAYDLFVTDTVPAHVTLNPATLAVSLNGTPLSQSGNYTPTYSGGVLTVDFRDDLALQPGGRLVLTYRGLVDADVPAGEDQINLAQVSWSSLPGNVPGDRDYTSATDSTNIHAGYPLLELTKDAAPGIVDTTELLTYTLRVTNSGIVSATSVIVTDVIPAHTTFVAATAPHAGPAPDNNPGSVITWSLGTLDVGESRSLTMTVRITNSVPAGTIIRNSAWVSSSEGLTDTDQVTTPIYAALGDYVWEDIDADGIQDDGNTGLNGVTVRLYRDQDGDGTPEPGGDDGPPISTTLTADDAWGNPGYYTFTRLIPGDYFVEFVPPTGYDISPQDQGSNDALDSDANPANGVAHVTTLVSAEHDPTWDAGLYIPAELGDYVWYDNDTDGIQDAGEPGISGVTVTLYSSDTGLQVGITTTNASGYYSFTNLVPDDYYVIFTPPPGWVFTQQDAGSNDALDSDADPTTGRTITINLESGESDWTWDAGLYAMDLGDLPDGPYPTLIASDGARHVILPADNPTLGSVVDAEPDGRPSAGANGDDLDGTPDDEDGVTFSGPLVPGERVTVTVVASTTADGLLNAWIDFNGDGDLTDAGEQIAVDLPITAGASVDLPVDVPVTATQGITAYARFRFSSDGGLSPTGLASDGEVEDYAVRIEELDLGDLPDGPYPTLIASDGARHVILPADNPTLGSVVDAEPDGRPSVGANGDDLDGTPDDEDGVTFLTPLMSGQPARVQVQAATDGYLNAWIDFNGDGDFDDAGEQIAVDLVLTPGLHILTFTVPNVSLGSSIHSRFRFNSDGGLSPTGLATDGEVEDYVLLSLGNLVWLDMGAGGGVVNDGRLNGSETGLAGVPLELYHGGQTPGVDTPLATTTTDASGHYTFTGLVSGTYMVYIPPSAFAPGAPLEGMYSSTGSGIPDDDLDQDTDENGLDEAAPAVNGLRTGLISLTPGGEPTTEDGDANSNLTLDFGLIVSSGIGDYVWLDQDRDGIQDVDETGVPSVTVILYDAGGTAVLSTTTDASGHYSFTNLLPGNYYLHFDPPTGYVVTLQNQGSDDAVDSDADPISGETITTNLEPGEYDPTWDVGLFQMADVSIYKGHLADEVIPGQLLTYTLTISNSGPSVAEQVVVTDALPVEVQFVHAQPAPDSSPNPVVWHLGDIPAGESRFLTLTVRVQSWVRETFTNTAVVVSTTDDDNDDNNEDDDETTPLLPSLALDKRLVGIDRDIEAPNYVTFTILITNVGPTALSVLPLRDLYDDHYLSFVDAVPYPEEAADDGDLAWHDLTGPAPNGFDRDLLPGETFVVTTVFRVVRNITTTVNTAIISDAIDVHDNPANPADDDEVLNDVPTAVELLYFRVGGVSGRSVWLEWATAAASDNFGFRRYRAAEPDRARAGDVAFVPSEAHGGGATYEYTDTVPYDGVWWYWLADVDTSGGETFHGPVSATVGAAVLPYRIYLPIVMR